MLFTSGQSWFVKNLSSNISALNDGDLSQIRWIFYALTEKDKPSKKLAATALSTILPKLSHKDIIWLDAQMRQPTSMGWYINWHKLKVENLFTPAMSDDERRGIIIFASLNHNGFIREQAVHLMAMYEGTFPYIMLRQNDWVLQVRQAATASFEKRLFSPSYDEMLSALPYAEKLKRSTRTSCDKHIEKFFKTLGSPEHKTTLLKGLKSDDYLTRKLCISALLDENCLDIPQAVTHLHAEKDPFLRRLIFEKLQQLGYSLIDTSQILLNDKYPANRLAALRYLYNSNFNPIRMLNIATACLLDKNVMVRALARKIVHESSPDFPFCTFYFNNLEKHTISGIMGIGEEGTKADISKIEIFLFDIRIAVVRAAMISLMKLDTASFKRLMFKQLNHSETGISKTAYELIVKYSIADFPQVFEIFQNTSFKHTKIKCAALLFKAPKWDALFYILELLSSEAEKINQLAEKSLQRWVFNFNKSFAIPSPEQRDRIQILLGRQKKLIPSKLMKELLFLLKM